MHVADPAPHPGFRRGLLAALVLGACWRVGVLVVDKWHQPVLLNDSMYYSAQATQLAQGTWFREIFVDRPGAEHGPLTSVLMALVSWGDDPMPWQRLVTVVCGIATIAVIGLVGRRVGGPRVGVVAAAIAAAYPNLWMNDGLIMSESVSTLAVSVVLLAGLRVVAAPSPAAAALAGLAAGLAALARSELALLVPGVALVLWTVLRPHAPSEARVSRPAEGLAATRGCADHTGAPAHSGRGGPGGTGVPDETGGETGGSAPAPATRRRWALAGLVVVTAVATMAPWMVFNLARFERPVLLTTNDGTTLLGSYCDDSFGGPGIGGWSLACVVADPDYAMDEEPSVRSARQRDLATTYARNHLWQLPKVLVARIGRTVDLYGLDSLVHQDVGEERYRWASWAGIVSWWGLGLLAVVGFRRLRGATRALLLLPCIAVAVTTVVFYGGHRIRSSMEPVVVVTASVAIVWLLERSEARRAVAAGRAEPGSAR